jgi:hypothetical protein
MNRNFSVQENIPQVQIALQPLNFLSRLFGY